MPWVVPWQPPRQPPRHSMATSWHVMATPTAPQCPLHLRVGSGLGLGSHGMPWRSGAGSVVCYGSFCRASFCRRWCHGMPRRVARKDNYVQACPKLCILTFSWPCHGTTLGIIYIPWHPHGIPWRGIRFHGVVVGAVVCHGWYDRVRLGLGLGFHGIPWRSVEGSVVCHARCRGRFCRRWWHGIPLRVTKKDKNVHASSMDGKET